MRLQVSVFLTVLTFALFLTGCPSAPPEPNKPNANAPANAPKTNTNGISEPVKTPPVPTTNAAPTLTSVFKAYCDAKTKNDEAALRKVYSQSTLKQFEADMKADGIKSLLKYLEVDKVTNANCEIRNEKIDGDVASAEVKTDATPNGITIKFVKENGEWKMTNESPDFKTDNADKNSNAAQKSDTAK